MKERILKVMEKEGLTPSRFAEAIGIQRSAMSHIISGRNNPSLDVLMKILSTYDYLSTEWLMFGKGNMYKADKATFQTSLFDELAINPPSIQVEPEYRKEIGVEKPVYPPKQPEPERIIFQERASKNVSKIMIFYSDNTFETFTPEKK